MKGVMWIVLVVAGTVGGFWAGRQTGAPAAEPAPEAQTEPAPETLAEPVSDEEETSHEEN